MPYQKGFSHALVKTLNLLVEKIPKLRANLRQTTNISSELFELHQRCEALRCVTEKVLRIVLRIPKREL